MSSENSDTLHQAVIDSLRRDPVALCCSIRSGEAWKPFSRGDFLLHVLAWSRVFRENLEPGSLVLFLKKLDIHLLSAYIGAMHAGVVPAQMSYDRSKLREEEFARKIRHALEITSAKAVFHDAAGPTPLRLPDGIRTFTPESFDPREDGAGPSRGPKALIQFSSGSTGLQKGVELSHASLLSQIRSYSGVLKLGDRDRLISWLPLYHDMGLIACYLMPLACGVPFYQMDPFDWVAQPDILLQAMEKFRGTVCFLPNFAYHVLARKGKDHDLGSMRLFVNCSEPAKRRTHEEFLQRFPSVRPEALTVCYAMAENTFAVTQSNPATEPAGLASPGDRDLSCGKPVPGTEIRIFEAGEGGEGEIGIRGSSLFDRFTDGGRPLEEGFYRTGDLGYLRPDGSLVVTGRKKDLIIVNGKNLHPQDVEFVCSGVEGVYPGRVAAFGIFDAQAGSEALHVLAESDGRTPPPRLKAAIQKAVSEETGIVPRRVEILAHMELAKTSSGKISRTRNRELFLSGRLRFL